MTRQALAVVWCCFLLAVYVRAVEWDCASSTNTGAFIRSNDCTINGNNHVAVANTLEIVGSNTDVNHLITITAASNSRHFYISYDGILMLSYVKLVGGNVQYGSGASILNVGELASLTPKIDTTELIRVVFPVPISPSNKNNL